MEEGGSSMAGLDGGSSSQRDENLLKSKHSIFLSHSGAQKSFVEQLCLDIEAHDRYSFFDRRRDSLSVGCDFPDSIFKVINQCQVAVVVLSEEFFSRSKWPMLELAALVKQKTYNPRLIIMPVFLGVTHAQCREKQNHDRWLKQWQCWAEKDNRIVIEEWLAALKVFGYTNGISLNHRLDEVKCRGEIVEAICKEVPPESKWDDSHVQGRIRLCRVIREKIEDVKLSECYAVRILGLYGVGGIGKSTACMALCNDFFKEFHGRVCHVEFGDGNELQMLQKVLKKLTDTKHGIIDSLKKDECKDRLKRTIKNQGVLLAIDNVSEAHHIVNQAKDMLRLGFEQGSIVIVTARSLGELQNLNIYHSECMEMPELIEGEAKTLFLYHAAPGLHMSTNDPAIEPLLRQCVRRCYFDKGNGIGYHYHPLALKVLGGQLGNNREEWREKLKEIDPFNQYREKEDMHPVFSILRRSFETLKVEDQLLFLDVATFHPTPSWPVEVNIFEWASMMLGRSVDAIMTMLKGLQRKSLLENLGDGNKKIGMHDLWREFAIMKAKSRESGLQPWIYEKVYGLNDPRREEFCLSGGGWKRLQRICVIGEHVDSNTGYGFKIENRKLVTRGNVKELNLSRCLNLRLLKLVDVFPETEVLDVSSLKQLQSLEISKTFTCARLKILGLGRLTNLLYLYLGGIQTETASLHEEIGGLTSLHVLHVLHVYPSHLSTTAESPDFSRLNSLRDVSFFSCLKADIISGLSSKMTHLKRFQIRGCEMLRSCHGVGDLIALELLELPSCGMLKELPNLGRLRNLLKMNISYCHSIEAVPGLDDLVSLQVFDACGCSKLADLPDMRKLANLQKLDMRFCPLIKVIPGLSDLIALDELNADYEGYRGCHDLCKLTKLERVHITRGWSAEGLPCLSDLESVKSLHIRHANGVVEWSGLLNLPGLQELRIQFCDFKDVQCLSNLTVLKSLEVFSCDKLERLPDMHKLSRLETIYISNCGSLREWNRGSKLRLFGADLHIAPSLLQLQTLHLHRVAFTELPDLSAFPELRKLILSECEELARLTISAPMTALGSLVLCGCMRLGGLPDLSHVASLSSFILERCGELKLTAHEIVTLEAMCPGLKLDRSHLPTMETERDDENDAMRDEKRLKLVENI